MKIVKATKVNPIRLSDLRVGEVFYVLHRPGADPYMKGTGRDEEAIYINLANGRLEGLNKNPDVLPLGARLIVWETTERD